MSLGSLLLAVILLTDVDALILYSGHRLPVDGPVRLERGQLVFRHGFSGILYSIAASEVDFDATRKGGSPEPELVEEQAAPARPVRKLAVSGEEKERILREMEKSRGVPSPPQPQQTQPLEAATRPQARPQADEAFWRGQSRRFDEQVRQQQENIALLQQQVRRMEDQLLALLSMGVDPNQFGYHVNRLEDTRTMLERARLALSRAERERDDFREQARRQGVLPGWLR